MSEAAIDLSLLPSDRRRGELTLLGRRPDMEWIKERAEAGAQGSPSLSGSSDDNDASRC